MNFGRFRFGLAPVLESECREESSSLSSSLEPGPDSEPHLGSEDPRGKPKLPRANIVFEFERPWRSFFGAITSRGSGVTDHEGCSCDDRRHSFPILPTRTFQSMNRSMKNGGLFPFLACLIIARASRRLGLIQCSLTRHWRLSSIESSSLSLVLRFLIQLFPPVIRSSSFPKCFVRAVKETNKA